MRSIIFTAISTLSYCQAYINVNDWAMLTIDYQINELYRNLLRCSSQECRSIFKGAIDTLLQTRDCSQGRSFADMRDIDYLVDRYSISCYELAKDAGAHNKDSQELSFLKNTARFYIQLAGCGIITDDHKGT